MIFHMRRIHGYDLSVCNNIKRSSDWPDTGGEVADGIASAAISVLISIILAMTVGLIKAMVKLIKRVCKAISERQNTVNIESYTSKTRYRGDKSRTGSGLLGIFFGPLGVHNFYLGGKRRIMLGFAQFFLSAVGVVVGHYLTSIGIWWGYAVGGIGLLWGYGEGVCILAGREFSYGADDAYVLYGRRGWLGIATVIHIIFCVIMFLIIQYELLDIIGGLI